MTAVEDDLVNIFVNIGYSYEILILGNICTINSVVDLILACLLIIVTIDNIFVNLCERICFKGKLADRVCPVLVTV